MTFGLWVVAGMAVLRSPEPVTLEQWHRVTAERLNKDGLLKVDQAPEVRRSSPGKAQGLNIHTPMYLGGVPGMDILPKAANVSMLFEGCIGEVSFAVGVSQADWRRSLADVAF